MFDHRTIELIQFAFTHNADILNSERACESEIRFHPLKKWVFNSYPICADFELWVFQFEGSTEHTAWLGFTSGHLAMTHHRNFVTAGWTGTPWAEGRMPHVTAGFNDRRNPWAEGWTPQATPGFSGRKSSHAAVSGFAMHRTLPSTCSGGWMLPGDTAPKARGLTCTCTLGMWNTPKWATAQAPAPIRVFKQNENLDKSIKSSHFTVQISGRRSGCIQGVWESERKENAEGQLHIQVSLLLQISLSWKITSDLPTAATKTFLCQIQNSSLCWWERRKASYTQTENK